MGLVINYYIMNIIMLSPTKRNLSKVQLLKILKSCKPESRIHLIKYLNDDGINALCEITFNLLFNNLKLPEKSKKKIKENYKGKRKDLKKIANKHISIKKRKALLIQHGGFLGTLLGVALPILSSLLTFGHK